ncbi:MAG: hypothetical protein PHW73_13320 [Atribacterota bacterium]|nr:hypothetical protein [Atribacterota bacterium]
MAKVHKDLRRVSAGTDLCYTCIGIPANERGVNRSARQRFSARGSETLK